MKNEMKIVWVMSLVFFSSCVMDKLYDPTDLMGKVRVATVWGDTPADTIAPADGYMLRVDEQLQEATYATTLFNALLFRGDHYVTAFNQPKGVNVNGDFAEIKRLGDGTLYSFPDMLMVGSKQATVVEGQINDVTVNLTKQLRNVVFVMEVNAIESVMIDSVTGDVSGIASAYDIIRDVVLTDNPGSVNMKYAFETLSNGKKALVARIQIFGVSLKNNNLGVHVRLKDGQLLDLGMEISSSFRNFRASREPLVLYSLLKLLDGTDVAARLTNWVEVDEGTIEVH